MVGLLIFLLTSGRGFTFFIFFIFNLRVFIKEQPQQEEQEILRSKDTQFAAVELPKCLEGPHDKGI